MLCGRPHWGAKRRKKMIKLIETIRNNRDFIVQKVNSIAGYFNEDKFKEINCQLTERNIVEEIKKNNIHISDFSPYVQELCGNDYSKLSLIIVLAYCVEV